MCKIDEYLKYLNQIDLVESNDPEIFEFLKETADSFTDIDLSTLLENIALSFDNRKKEYSALDSHSLKNIKIKEWRELYTYANHRFNRYGVYANATYDKYKSVLVEALEFCETEARKLSISIDAQTKIASINSKTYTTKDYVMAYIIECFATDVKPPSGEKSKLEEIGKELLKPINGNGNTFYKKFNDHFLHISKTDNQYLIENWGSDWQSIVLDLAKDKEEVSNYLKNNR